MLGHCLISTDDRDKPLEPEKKYIVDAGRSAHDDCTGIVVTYAPEITIFETQIRALCAQLGLVIIVDNGSGPGFRKFLAGIQQSHVWVQVVLLDKNYGIAYAQNRGLELAKCSGRRYALFLDHDSIPTPNLVSGLYAAAESLRAQGVRLAAVGARLIDPRSGRENGFYRMRKWRWERLCCEDGYAGLIACGYLNSSGSLHPLDAMVHVGGFDESFFIDHVDTDWFMRARAMGYKAYGVCSAVLVHHMGNFIIRYWFFGWRLMPHRSPSRHYFIVRNAFWLYRRPYVPFFWKINNLFKIVFTLLYFGLFDRERGQQARMILRGAWDGITARGQPDRGQRTWQQ